MKESLKEQAFKGVGWSTVEKFSVQGIQFVLQIVLARLLLPSDYGIVAMLAIFLQIAQVFVDGGFANALIQKQSCSEKDYSTVFFYNLFVSIIIYIFLYAIAPLVANFYNESLLVDVMRVSSLVIILNSLSIVQRTKLIKEIDFKSLSIVNFTSALLSGIIGVTMAYKGFGVWALCFQSLFNSVFVFLFLYYFVKWKPSLTFSKESFHELFNFGSKLLTANIISVIYGNLYTIIIGKKFSSKELGYYSRAEQFSSFPSSNISSIISGVAFPLLSKIQDDNLKLRFSYEKFIRVSSFIMFPLMIILSSLSDPFISVLLGEQWRFAAKILQVLCLAYMWDHLSSLNLNLLYVKGMTDIVLKLEIIKKIIAVSILLFSLPYGILAMCWGRVIYSILAFYINAFYANKLIQMSFWSQLKLISPILMLSVIAGSVSYLCQTLLSYSNIVILLIGFMISSLLYLIFSLILFDDIRGEFFVLIKKKRV